MFLGHILFNACFYARSKGSPQSSQITLTSRIARMMVPQQGQTYLSCFSICQRQW